VPILSTTQKPFFVFKRPQSSRVAFLPAFLLVGVAIIGGAFVAGTRSAGGQNHIQPTAVMGTTYTMATFRSSGVPGVTDEDHESGAPPSTVLVLLSQTLRTKCVQDPTRTVTLDQGEADRLYHLACRENRPRSDTVCDQNDLIQKNGT
jgi:hypothetical protein